MTVDFAAQLLDLPLIYLMRDNLSLGIYEEWKLCSNCKEKSDTPPKRYLSNLQI